MAVIAVSWIQGVVRIATTTTSKVNRMTEAGSLVSNPADFLTILNQLLTTTRVSGTEVVICTDNPVINPLVESTPPATPKVAANLLARRVEKAKPFPEPSVFGFTRVNPEDKTGQQSYLVTASPKKFVEEMDLLISQQGLDFVGYYPAALSLRPVLRSLKTAAEEVILLVADAETGLMQVIGRSSGQVLFYRTMGASDGRGVEGVQREIRRTILFAEQKLNAKITTVFASGSSAVGLVQGMSGVDGLLVYTAGLNVDPDLYLKATAGLKSSATENILPSRISQRGKRRRLRMALNLVLGGLLLFTFLDSTRVQVTKHQLLSDIRIIGNEIAERQQQLTKVREELAALTTRQETIRILTEELNQPVIEVLFHSLDQVIPSGVVLSGITFSNDGLGADGRAEYVVRLDGDAPEGIAVLPLLTKVKERLETSVWKAVIEEKTGDPEIPGNTKKEGAPENPGVISSVPASGSRAAPLRGLALHLYNLFVHPGFQGVTLLACGGIFYYNQTTLKPLYLQKSEAQGTSNSLLVEKNKLVKMMPGVRIEDLNRQMDAQKSKLVQNENQVNAECKKISKEMEDLEWLGEVTPQAAVQSFPQIQFLKHFPIEVVLKSPPEIAEKIEEKDATRLFQFLRQVEKTKKLHFLRKLEIQADPKAGWTVKMEYDFFMIQEVPGG